MKATSIGGSFAAPWRCNTMGDRTAEFEAAIRAQAGVILAAQALLTRYSSKEMGPRRSSTASYGFSTGRSNAGQNASHAKPWASKSRATSPDGCCYSRPLVERLLKGSDPARRDTRGARRANSVAPDPQAFHPAARHRPCAAGGRLPSTSDR